MIYNEEQIKTSNLLGDNVKIVNFENSNYLQNSNLYPDHSSNDLKSVHVLTKSESSQTAEHFPPKIEIHSSQKLEDPGNARTKIRNKRFSLTNPQVLKSMSRSTQSKSMTLGNDGGYQDLLITVDNKIAKDYNAVNNLIKIINHFSKFLFISTGNRLWIKSINIVLPKFWGSPPAEPPEFENLRKAYRGIQNINNVNLAVLKILPTPSKMITAKNHPLSFNQITGLQAVKSTPCGEPGNYLQEDMDITLSKIFLFFLSYSLSFLSSCFQGFF